MNRLSILCVAALSAVLVMAWVAQAGPASHACCQPACAQPVCQPACEQPAPPACEPACCEVQRVGLLARLRARCEARRAAKACAAPVACEEVKPACEEVKPACEEVKVEACAPECPPPVHRCRLFGRHHRVVVVQDACCEAAPAAPAQAAEKDEAPPAPQPQEAEKK